MKYNAFISYSQAADGRLAPALQTALEKFAKPWYKTRNLNIFRDTTSLSASPHLWSNIQKAMEESEYLIYMASPLSEDSKWVNKEVGYWLEHKSIDKLIIVLTEGEILWDENNHTFLHPENNSLPEVLDYQFTQEPYYVDLRISKSQEDLSLNNPIFKKEVLKIAAQLHGKEPKDMASEEVRAHKRMMLVRNGAITILTLLLGFSIFQTFEAKKQTRIAEKQTLIARDSSRVAQEQRKIAEEQTQIAKDSSTVAREQRKIALLEKNKALQQEKIAIENKLIADSNRELADSNAARAKRNKVKADSNAAKANRERDRANENLKLSTARRLAAEAKNKLLIDPELSVLLSMESLEEKQTLEGEEALHQAFLELRIIKTISQHTNEVTALKYSNSGNLLFSGGKDSVFNVYNTKDEYSLIFSRKMNSSINEIELFPERNIIAVGSKQDIWLFDKGNFEKYPQTIKVSNSCFAFNTIKGTLIVGKENGEVVEMNIFQKKDNKPKLLYEHGGKVNGICFEKNNEILSSVSDDKTIYTLIDHCKDSRVIHDYEVMSLDINNNGTRIATSSRDLKIKIFNSENLEQIKLFEGHTNNIYDVEFNHTGTNIASASADKSIIIWDINSEKEIYSLRGHKNKVNKISYQPNNNVLASASSDGTIKVWSLDQPYEIFTLTKNKASIYDVRFNNANTTLAALDSKGNIYLMDITNNYAVTDSILGNDNTYARGLAFHPTEKIFAYGCSDKIKNKHSIILFNYLDKHKDTIKTRHCDLITDIEFSPRGDKIISAARDNLCQVWNTSNLTKPAFDLSTRQFIYSVCFSPDQKYIVGGGIDSTLYVWDADNGSYLFKSKKHFSSICKVIFSKDGTKIASSTQQGEIYIFSFENDSLVQLQKISAHSDQIFDMKFLQNDKKIVSASWDRSMKILTLGPSESYESELVLNFKEGLYTLDINPTENRLAVAGIGHSVYVLSLDVKELIAIAGNRVRNSSENEKTQYIIN